jgi:hypothetical protein
MDPNFVQHSITDLITRFAGYLIFIGAYSTAISGGVNGMFKMFGVDLDKTKADTFVIACVGMIAALLIDLNMFFYIAGITNAQFTHSAAERWSDGAISGWVPAVVTITFCNLVTGTLVVGGKKVIKGIATEFAGIVSFVKGKFGNGDKKAAE